MNPITLPCPGCGGSLRLAPAAAGKKARCPRCSEIVAVPGPAGSSRVGARMRGRGGSRLRPGGPPDGPDSYEPEGGSRNTTIIACLAIAGLGLAAVIAMAVWKSGQRKAPTETEGALLVLPPPAPPAPRVEDRTREEIQARVRDWVDAYNANDLERLKGFYACPFQELEAAFADTYFHSDLKLENWSVTGITPGATTCIVQLRYDKVRKDKSSGRAFPEPGRERSQTWLKSGGRWMLQGAPEQ